ALAAMLLVFGLALGDGSWTQTRLLLTGVIVAAGCGAAVSLMLALSGLAMQVLLRNPLADPYVLGTSGGAAVGALLALLLGLSLWLGAAAGALLAGAVLLVLARSALAEGDDASARLILTGAMIAAITGATTTLLLTITPDEYLRGAIFWLVGDLSGAQQGWVCVLAAVVFTLALTLRARSVDRMMLGSEAAALLGEPVRRRRYELLLAASLAAAIAVATAGAIGFVGLVVPQLLRFAGVQRTRDLAWMSGLGGGALLVAADLAARTVVAPMELPVGAVMALIGAPLFIGFLLRSSR
ncbi:MAG: iron chelate uptake ABC transporter family permease subunit, partial [Burkholderiaceae bacterium]|nr:iron chelate uptake ABC transporter family permease subunit [Burkholderiaceae bacterium]